MRDRQTDRDRETECKLCVPLLVPRKGTSALNQTSSYVCKCVSNRAQELLSEQRG